MVYRLYNRVGSGGVAVEAALTLAGAPFELVELDSAPGAPLPESFRVTNPWRQVPTLILPDGTTMTESAAILIHLAMSHPHADLAPTPGTSAHARFLRYIIFAAINVYEPGLRAAYPQRFTTDAAAEEGTCEAARLQIARAWRVLEAEIEPEPFVFGRTIGAIDLYLAMLLGWFDAGAETPRLQALRAPVAEEPRVAPVWRRHFAQA